MIMHDITQFHFLRPWWLLALLPLTYIVIKIYRYYGSQHQWAKACDAHLLPHLLEQTPTSITKWTGLITAIGLLLTTIALAGPAWKQLPQPVYNENAARVIIFDLSPAMLATDVPPSRLVRARYKLLDLLHLYTQGQTGLVVYSGEPYIVSPLTEDTNTIASMVPDLTPEIMPMKGNNLSTALNLGAKLLQQAGFNKGQLVVIASSPADNAAIATAKKLAQTGINTSVLAIGTEKNMPITLDNGQYLKDQNGAIVFSRLDAASLQQLAQAGNGNYALFTANTADVHQLTATDNNATAFNPSKEKAKTNLWQDEGWWLVWLLLPLGLWSFRRGWFGD
jgi:Ca-activated chloride channel family protein